jgi:ribosome-binding protein aMBF1 (putative translation factor)
VRTIPAAGRRSFRVSRNCARPVRHRYRRTVEPLRQAREDAGLTQQQVAERLELYASFVSKVESGERRLDVDELAGLCEGLRR